jgi:Tol biopolymer transport system component
VRVLLVLPMLMLAACSNPLQREASVETNLSPTRTPSPRRTEPTTSALDATPEVTRETEPAVAATLPATTAEATAAAAAVTTPRYALCTSTKPDIRAVVPPKVSAPGQIAYLTPDGNIVLTDGVGRSRINITADAFVSADGQAGRIYQFPTFSADGQTLAFVSIATTSDFNGITHTVHTAPATNAATLTDLFATSEFNIPYLDFSPDGAQVAFLTISAGAGAINVVDTGGGAVTEFDNGTPTYWHWRQDSSAMLTHLGGRATEKGEASISVIESKGATKVTHTVLEALPGNFQSPHFSPDGQHMVYVANTSELDELILANADGNPLCTLTVIENNAFFAWSPDGARLALIDTRSPINSPAPLKVFDLRDGSDMTLHEEATSFFWSPDGSRLAVYSIVFDPKFERLTQSNAIKVMSLAAPVQQTAVGLRIEVIDVTSGDKIKVADTLPSRQWQQYFPFFDQYSRSLTPWSPDGTQLVFTTVTPASGTTDATADVVVATFDSTGVRLKRVAAGTLAFWSPR